ncbi:hypothetical protein YT1_5327 [Rhodococcus ruber]|nr:hypothetical protein YT1_5327 [Rhodococcus ruber]
MPFLQECLCARPGEDPGTPVRGDAPQDGRRWWRRGPERVGPTNVTPDGATRLLGNRGRQRCRKGW